MSFGENNLGAAWETVSEEAHVSLEQMNGGSAVNYLLLGFCNLLWVPTVSLRKAFAASSPPWSDLERG